MKCRKSLKRSVISYFVITCVVLVVGYSIFLSQYLTQGISLFVQFRLEEVAGNYLQALDENPDAPLPKEGPIKGYDAYGDLPADVREAATPDQLTCQRFTYVRKDSTHYEVYSLERPDGRYAFIVFSATQNQMTVGGQRRFDFYHVYTPALAGLLAILIVQILAFRIFKQVTKPIEELHEWAFGLSPDNLDKKSLRFKYDELNNVAELILNTSKRLVARGESEKRFQKYASHELRTPIAILQNNLELQERLGIAEDKRYKTSHARMVKATRNMSNLTNTLLWLSRELKSPLPVEDINSEEFLREIIDENVYLLEGKNVSIATELDAITFRSPRILVHIILVNLVRNAFQHTYEGKITIKADQTRFEIANPADSLEENTSESAYGYGLGLQLSAQLAEKIGWSIHIEEKNGLFLVRVDNEKRES